MAWDKEKPLVLVTALLSFSQIGWVTYLATRECLDLISGNGSDMFEEVTDTGTEDVAGMNTGGCVNNCWQGQYEERLDRNVRWPLGQSYVHAWPVFYRVKFSSFGKGAYG